jgi:alkylation response protein AidB-like acyl-CoA dehydrogenase
MVPISGFTTSAIVAAIYDRFGTPRQKETVLAGLALGEVETIARSEPDAGSDLAGLACRAEPRNGGFLVNGENTCCSNADIADRILLIARTSGTAGSRDGVTMFQVPAHADGLTLRPSTTMSGRDAHDLIFTDCFLPEQAVVGKVGRGWRQLMAGLNIERLVLAATLLGTAQRAFDDTLAYVKQQRRQFGRPIGSFQVLRHRLADLATEIECSRLLVYRTAALVDGEPSRTHPREASMAKLKTAETAKRVALEGMQMLSGSGYAMEYDMDRHVRTTLLSMILGGTSDSQREAIGRVYGL